MDKAYSGRIRSVLRQAIAGPTEPEAVRHMLLTEWFVPLSADTTSFTILYLFICLITFLIMKTLY